MADAASSLRVWLDRWASEPYAYLTTTGRRSARPHRIEIWFAVEDGRLFLLSGGRDQSDWVRNLRSNARVSVEVGDATYDGLARILAPGTDEDARARELLVSKYATPGNSLDDWRQRSLPVVIEFPEPAGGAPR